MLLESKRTKNEQETNRKIDNEEGIQANIQQISRDRFEIAIKRVKLGRGRLGPNHTIILNFWDTKANKSF